LFFLANGYSFFENALMEPEKSSYRGRLAPTPTGYLHLGHARTFWTAQERAKAAGGTLILRNDDLDRTRCKPEFARAMLEDLKWFGFEWTEGPDVGGAFGPYRQSERFTFYRTALETLREARVIYPCYCSRRDIQSAAQAPHAADDEEPIYPGTCRNKPIVEGAKCSWRFRVPDGEAITFNDQNLGARTFVCGQDFGDFVVWRNDDVPAYQLACVVDDAAMEIAEMVRGEDLLLSTARQLLLYRALRLKAPAFFHCPLMLDEKGQRLAKRSEALSLRTLRKRGMKPEELRHNW
jgi:glutamyl/glutaminyl-tRNA synthetase